MEDSTCLVIKPISLSGSIKGPVLSSRVVKACVNLCVMSPLSDWEVGGSNPTAGMSMIGFFIQGRNFYGFPW